MRFSLLRASGVVGVAAAAVLVTAVTPAGATTAGTDQGSAYGASARVSVLSGVLGPTGITVNAGQLAVTDTEGPTSESVVDAALDGLVTAKAIHSSSNYDKAAGTEASSAALLQVKLPVLATVAGHTPSASAISSQCKATADGITGTSDLADLDLGTLGHVSVATPNLKLGVPGVLQVIANEQVKNPDGSLTVNALDITLLGGQVTGSLGNGHIVLASSTCGAVQAAPASPSPTHTPKPTPTAPSTPAPRTKPTTPAAPRSGHGQVSIVPVGAPETGDGTLATVITY
jgi:hypothetical protein